MFRKFYSNDNSWLTIKENFIVYFVFFLDFRTPLFCITLMLEKLKSDDLDNNSKTESIEIAETNTTLLENYVNDILDLK